MLQPDRVAGSTADWLRRLQLTTRFQPIYEHRGEHYRLFALEGFCRNSASAEICGSADVLFDRGRRHGVESQLDRLCLERLMAELPLLPAGEYSMALNLHPETISVGRPFYDYLFDLLERADLQPGRLIIELVEHGRVAPDPGLVACLDELRSRGVTIAIDDLCQGRSNLRSVLDYRPDFLKIDRYVVGGVARDDRRRALVETCVLLASRTESRLVAEGVEQPEDLAQLRELGIDLFQGYLLAPPMPAAAFDEPASSLSLRLASGGVACAAADAREKGA